jgi:rhamnosyltransferase subunit B
MRILVECIGSYGDVFPFVAIGREMLRRGHEVYLFANAHFGSLIQEAGLVFIEAGDGASYEAFTRHPDTWEPRKGFKNILKMLATYLPEGYDKLAAHVLPGQTLIIGSTLAIASRILEEKHQLPGVKIHLAPSIFRSNIQPPKLPALFMPDWYPKPVKKLLWWLGDRLVIDPIISKPVNQFRSILDLPPISRVFCDWIHSPALTIGLFPDWFGVPQPDWPTQVRCTGFPLLDTISNHDFPEDVRAFLASGDPPVVFTSGTAMRHGHDFFNVSTEVCKHLGIRGILLTRYGEQLPKALPADVRHFPYIPLSALLPNAAALVHHGGIGTSSQAMRAGIPQLIRPMAFDQFDNAFHLERLGVALSIDLRLYNTTQVEKKLERLIKEPAYTLRCRAIARWFDGVDAVSESCDLIDKMINKRDAFKAGGRP